MPKGNFRTAYNNIIMSQNFYVSLDTHKHFKCLNEIIYGTTGTGKTRYNVKPNLLQMNCNYVITDPSGDTLKGLGEAQRRNGYDIKVCNFKTLKDANTYNPLAYCHTEKEIRSLAEAFITNTKGDTSNSTADPFWDDSFKALLCCLIALLTQVPKWDSKKRPYAQIPEVMGGKIYLPCFANIAEFVRMCNKKYNPLLSPIRPYGKAKVGSTDNNLATGSELAIIFENIRAIEAEKQGKQIDLIEKPYCLIEWENFKIAPDKTSTTILMTAATNLDPFNIPEVKAYTSTDTLDLYHFMDHKTAIYIIIDVNDPTYNFLASFLFTQMFRILYDDGETNAESQLLLKLQNGDYIRRFKKADQESGYMEKKMAALRNCTIQEQLLAEYSGTTKDKKGKQSSVKFYDRWYDIIDEDGEVVTRRVNKADAENVVKQLKTIDPKRYTNDCQLAISTRFFIDEFANIGEIPKFTSLISTCRKYELSCTVILQDLTQLKKMYEKDHETIDTNCPFKIFLGGSGNETNEALSKKIGKATKIGNNVSDDNQRVNMSYNVEERDLIQSAEMGRLDPMQCLILVDGEQPLKDLKFDYPAHRYYQMTHDYASSIKCYEGSKFIFPTVNLENVEISFKVDENGEKMDSSTESMQKNQEVPILSELDLDTFLQELNIIEESVSNANDWSGFDEVGEGEVFASPVE